jgi:hypothetical protein
MSRSTSAQSVRLQGRRALITGASSGIGAEFARQLAQMGCALVITARRQQRLEQLAKELQADCGAQARVLALDLGAPNAAIELKSWLDRENLPIDILINNAGFGLQAEFMDRSWDEWERVIDLDIKAFTQISHVFADDMRARGVSGNILQVGSIFSFGGVPTYAVYSAAKSYVLAFSEALADELEPHKIAVTTLAPGVTQTEFFDTASDGRVPTEARKIMQTPQQVVKDGIEAMLANRPLIVSGWINRAMVFSRRLRSRQSATRAIGRASRS